MKSCLRFPCGLLLLALALTACAGVAPPPPSVAGPAAPERVITPLASPPPSPTPTSLAEGMETGLSTPDPNPNCPDHYPWFFNNRADECGATILGTWAAFETFEHGLMVWTQEGGHTYVLIDDGSPFKPYQEVTDPQGLPISTAADPALKPPAGRLQPVMGFGKFWRGQVPGSEWVRARLGWATAPESDYSAFWQCNTASGDGARCYLSGPRDEVLVLARGSAQYWTYWQRAVR